MSRKVQGGIKEQTEEVVMRSKEPQGGRSNEEKGASSVKEKMKKKRKIEKVARRRIIDHSVLF